MSDHELQRWLERNSADLRAADIRTELGRGPSIGSRRGATWISFESKDILGRAVLSITGDCALTARNKADGVHRLDTHQACSSGPQLDDALAGLLHHLR
jgi:hypothetical protein